MCAIFCFVYIRFTQMSAASNSNSEFSKNLRLAVLPIDSVYLQKVWFCGLVISFLINCVSSNAYGLIHIRN